MADIALLPAHGAQSQQPSRYKPISTFRFFTGYFTNRNPFRSPLSVFYAEGWGIGKADSLIDGLNIEVSPRLTPIRRPGFIPYSTATLPSSILGFYSFQRAIPIQNPIDLIVDTATGVYKLTTSSATLIYSKAPGAGKAYFLGLGNSLYIADGAQLQVWQDGGSLRNWGIAIGPFSGQTGPVACTAGSDVSYPGGTAWTTPSNVTGTSGYASVTLSSSNSGSTGAVKAAVGNNIGGGAGWTNINNILQGGSGYANISLSPGGTSATLTLTSLGLNLPVDATITSVVVSVTRAQTGGSSAMYMDSVNLLNVPGSIAQYDPYGSPWPSTPTATSYTFTPSSSVPITPAMINSSSFGFSFQADCTGAPGNGATGEITGATVTINYTSKSTGVSDYLQATGFGFSASTTNISGIQISLTGYQSSTPGYTAVTVTLLKNGVVASNPKTNIVLPTSSTTLTFGGSGDLWGVPWSGGDISQLGVQIQAFNSSGSAVTFYVQNVKASIWATGGPPVSVSGSGSMTAKSGYQYVAAYGNSNSGHVSSATPPSNSTGPFTNAAGVKVSLTASNDPQVNQIWVFRTTDGGSTFLNIPNSPFPNTTQQITDSATDTALNILLQAPLNGVNNPPPAGMLGPVYHQGRVWGFTGNILYASTGPDVLVGNGAEAFNPLNYWSMPAQITRLVPTTIGLVVFMTTGIQIMAGGPAISQYYPQVLMQTAGLLNYNAVDINGAQAYVFTSERQFILLDLSSGISELGYPIEDKLLNLDPTQVSVAFHNYGLDRAAFVCDGVNGWYRVNDKQPPDYQITGPVWSPRGQLASGGLNLLQSVAVSPGYSLLLAATTSGQVLYRDSTYNQFADNGTPYEAYGTLGSIVLVNPGQLAEVAFITSEFAAVGSVPSISVLLDELSGNFEPLVTSVNDPPYLYGTTGAPSSIYSKRFYFRQTVNSGVPAPAWCRHLQVKFDFGSTDTVPNEMLSNTVWGAILEEAGA